jgi:hypothetical protein
MDDDDLADDDEQVSTTALQQMDALARTLRPFIERHERASTHSSDFLEIAALLPC